MCGLGPASRVNFKGVIYMLKLINESFIIFTDVYHSSQSLIFLNTNNFQLSASRLSARRFRLSMPIFNSIFINSVIQKNSRRRGAPVRCMQCSYSRAAAHRTYIRLTRHKRACEHCEVPPNPPRLVLVGLSARERAYAYGQSNSMDNTFAI